MINHYAIDLFSDTNSGLSEGMRQAMASAEVGNEVAGEDPTVNRLLEKCCKEFNKEAAVFLASGALCNTLCFRAWCSSPGQGIIIESTAQPLLKNPTIFSGVVSATPLVIKGHGGKFTSKELKNVLEKNQGYNMPTPALVSIENPTNFGGGGIWSLKELEEVYQYSYDQHLPVHTDGARMMMAHLKTGIPLKDYAALTDSLYIDFCKCVGAPMGSVILGSKEFIDKIWFHKFQLGGYLHKAGILAASCLYGWEHQLPLMASVISLSKNLATELSKRPFVEINPTKVEINIIYLSLKNLSISASVFQRKLEAFRIRVLATGPNQLRLILHSDINEKHIFQITEAFDQIGTHHMLSGL